MEAASTCLVVAGRLALLGPLALASAAAEGGGNAGRDAEAAATARQVRFMEVMVVCMVAAQALQPSLPFHGHGFLEDFRHKMWNLRALILASQKKWRGRRVPRKVELVAEMHSHTSNIDKALNRVNMAELKEEREGDSAQQKGKAKSKAKKESGGGAGGAGGADAVDSADAVDAAEAADAAPTGPPPLVEPAVAAVLTERITALFESLKPSEEEEVNKADCLVQMRGLLKDGGIGNGIHLYGSSASLCGFGTSDMDLCLLSPPVEGDAAGEGGGDTKEGEAGGGAGAAAAAAVAAAVAGIDVVARANVLRQMEFYFSDSNLQNDRFLRGKVAEGGEEGFVDIALLNSFKRMQSYGLDDAAVCAVLRADSATLVLSDDGSAVRRKVAVGAAADLPGHTQVQRELLTEAADLLESSGAAGAFEVSVRILDARVPILKLQHRATGIECDMCVDNTLAIRNTLLLRTYASIDPRVRGLVFAVKRWAKAREIGDAHRSTLSSYAHTLTVIFYLQVGCSPPVLPSLQDPDLVGDKWAVPAEGEGGKTYDVSFCEDAAEAKAFLAGKAGESGANTQVSACVCVWGGAGGCL